MSIPISLIRRSLRHRSHSPLAPRRVLGMLPRLFDDLPIWAQLNITWQCNLDCAYCVEYDNSRPHVPLAELKRRIDRCAELGVRQLGLIGGEPLLHPDLERIIEHVRARGLATGITTNGFLLSRERLDALLAAGLGWVQLSIDGVRPSRAAPKSLKTLAPKLEMLARAPLLLRVAVVLCPDTLEGVTDVAEYCFARGIGVSFAVQHHDGLLQGGAATAKLLAKLDWLRRQKQAGKPVATPYYVIEYFERVLRGDGPSWTCLGGSKCMYITTEGELRPCAHVASGRQLLDVTRAELSRERGKKKGCEQSCGVGCVVQASLPYSEPSAVLRAEAAGYLAELRQSVSPSW